MGRKTGVIGRLVRLPAEVANALLKLGRDRIVEWRHKVSYEQAADILATCDAEEVQSGPWLTGSEYGMCQIFWTDASGKNVASGLFWGERRRVTIKGVVDTVFEGAEGESLSILGCSRSVRQADEPEKTAVFMVRKHEIDAALETIVALGDLEHAATVEDREEGAVS
jgi:hypothetical protein